VSSSSDDYANNGPKQPAAHVQSKKQVSLLGDPPSCLAPLNDSLVRTGLYAVGQDHDDRLANKSPGEEAG